MGDNQNVTPASLSPSNAARRSAGRRDRGFFRRTFLLSSLGLVVSDYNFGAGQSRVSALETKSGDRSRMLVRPTHLKGLDTRSKIVVELEGELRLNEPDPNKPQSVRRADVKGKSTLDYFEKLAFKDSKLVAGARNYVEARAENWISGSASSQELRPECRETRLLQHDERWEQYCESESLDLREIELLHSPLNSAALELFLPTEPAKPTSKWTISAESAAALFNLDVVHESSLTAQVAKVEQGVATIELTGELAATANSVPTRLKINGNIRAQFSQTCVLVTWVGLVINETREISQAEPGFNVTARLRLIRKTTENEFDVSTEDLQKLAEKEDLGRWLVKIESTSGRFSLLTDRKWRTYFDTGEEAILRMIENNMVVAQCNVTRLPKLDEGSQLTLDGLQNDVRKALGKGFGQFIESRESVTSGGLRLLRCVVEGSAEDVPVQWIYSHLSDDSGRRVALIFTMGGNVTDRFAAADEQMTASFELLPEPEETDAGPTKAPKQPTREANKGTTTR